MSKPNPRPLGTIKVNNDRGYAYLPKQLREELALTVLGQRLAELTKRHVPELKTSTTAQLHRDMELLKPLGCSNYPECKFMLPIAGGWRS